MREKKKKTKKTYECSRLPLGNSTVTLEGLDRVTDGAEQS